METPMDVLETSAIANPAVDFIIEISRRIVDAELAQAADGKQPIRNHN